MKNHFKLPDLKKLLLFTDGSVHVQSGVGYGAFLLISDESWMESADELREKVLVQRFEATSSTKLELQTLLWALGTVHQETNELIVFSDSQNISGLLERRRRLEQNKFHSKTGRRLTNADLYMQFFSQIDKLKITFVKVKGHRPSKMKNKTDRLFTLVDRASRQALRNEIKE